MTEIVFYLPLFLAGSVFISCSGEATTDPGVVGTGNVATVTVSPNPAAIPTGGQLQLSVTLKDASGATLTGRSITWSSSNSSVAAVDATGMISGVATGSAMITAASEGKEGTADVTVFDAAAGTINLIAGITHQTIIGWEATAEIGQTDFPPSDYTRWRDAVADSAAAIGINRLRLEIRAGIENTVDYFSQWQSGAISRPEWTSNWYEPVNDNADPFSKNAAGFQFSEMDEAIDQIVLPLRQRLAARGEALYVNLNFIDFTDNASFEHRDSPDEYGEFILAAFEHIDSKYSWVPDAVEVILEPDNGTGWNGAHVGQAISAAGARLANAGYTPDFIAPSNTNMAGAITYFDQAIAVPGALQYLKELSYHRYSGVSDSNLNAIGSRARQRGIRASMLEHIGSGYQDLHKDLTLARNSAWQQFVLAFPTNDNGAQYLLPDFNTASVRVSNSARYLRQYFEFVRRGAQRIEATSQDGSLSPLGFINTNGKYVVVVKADAGRSFSIGGLPPGTYGVTYTTSSEYRTSLADVTIGAGQVLDTSIPASGVITIFGKN